MLSFAFPDTPYAVILGYDEDGSARVLRQPRVPADALAVGLRHDRAPAGRHDPRRPQQLVVEGRRRARGGRDQGPVHRGGRRLVPVLGRAGGGTRAAAGAAVRRRLVRLAARSGLGRADACPRTGTWFPSEGSATRPPRRAYDPSVPTRTGPGERKGSVHERFRWRTASASPTQRRRWRADPATGTRRHPVDRVRALQGERLQARSSSSPSWSMPLALVQAFVRTVAFKPCEPRDITDARRPRGSRERLRRERFGRSLLVAAIARAHRRGDPAAARWAR